MKLLTVKHAVHATVMIPGSKSISNRSLMLAALAQGRSALSGFLISEDTLACIEALKNLGIGIEIDEKKCQAIVEGCSGLLTLKKANIFCRDSGIVARFLLAICATQKGHYTFNGSKRLCERPVDALLDILRAQGASTLPEKVTTLPCELMGASLQGGDIVFDSDDSSQYISALLIAAPLMKSDVCLSVKTLKRRAFIQLTCDVMAEFGVQVVCENNHYRVSVKEHYRACDYMIEPDMSSASYFFAAAAVTKGSVTVLGANRQTMKQGDIKFVTVLESMGCDIIQKKTGLTVKGPSKLQGVDIDMNDFSDTFMTLACLAPFANTPTTITGLAHTRLQESDRIEAISRALRQLHIKVETGDNWIKIYPGQPVAGVVDSCNDHRIAMSLAIVGLRVPGIELLNPKCIAKTFPDFFERWAVLGVDKLGNHV